MTPRCVACGRFIATSALDEAEFYHEPDSHKGPEVNEWTCLPCIKKEGRYVFTVWDLRDGDILEVVHRAKYAVLDQLRHSYDRPYHDIQVEEEAL